MAAQAMYTRGQPGDDNRGESLVQQHMDRMQQQKEAAAMDKLRQLMPQMGDMVRALALAKAEWDIDTAVSMLRSFQVSHLDKLNTINKKRKRIREDMESWDGSREPDEKPSPSRSGKDGSSDSSDSSSESDRDADRKSKKRKHSSTSRHKRDKDKKKHKKLKKRDDKQGKRKKRKHADSSDEEGDGKAHNKLTHTEDFGKYGYIRETDMSAKHSEFVLWATEVKAVNVELLGKAEEKELFREYMEDYNTGTLKHRKYYDLEAYERSEAMKAAKARSGSKQEAVFDARADEEALKRQRIEERRKFQQDRLNEAYNLLKHTDRAKDMREQELLRAEMALAYKTGDRARAQKIFERLQPEDQKK